MKIKPFLLERYFAEHEFSTRYLLSSSDCDGLAQSELLSWADPESRALWEKLKLGYTESRGLPLLREEVAKLYHGVDADDVLIAAPEECIFIALNCTLKAGDHVICTYPGYQSLYELAESIGCEVDKWRPREEAGWHFDVDALLNKVKPRTKLIIVNFPHNPTGALPPKPDYLKIIEIAKTRGIHLFSDEMYRYLELDAKDRLPSACEIYDKAITLFGMSKSFGMAGVRIGWLATKDAELYKRMAEFKDYTTICSAASSEILSLIGLRVKDTILARNLKRINRNLDLLDNFFQNYRKSFRWNRPKAGTIGFPRLLTADDPEQFCKDTIRKAEVLLLPSTVYGYDQPHFRIGFGRENMPEALLQFEKSLNGSEH